MKCYIIDDEPYAIDSLSGYVLDSKALTLSGSSTDTMVALDEIKALGNIEIVFLDVDMPVLSGIEVAKLLSNNISIIFTTAHCRYAVEGFDLAVSDFLLKPISLPRFLKSVEKVKKLRIGLTYEDETPIKSLFINPGIKGKILRVRLNDIIYVEGLKNYVIIFINDKTKIITYLTMGEIQSSLPDRLFLRIHKSHIINRNHIVSIEGNQVKMDINLNLPIGLSYRESFMNHIASNIVKSKRGVF